MKNSGKRWLKATTSARFRRNSKKFIIKKKKGDPALKITDDGRGQLGHLQRELGACACMFPGIDFDVT